jgi:hypothetical protein
VGNQSRLHAKEDAKDDCEDYTSITNGSRKSRYRGHLGYSSKFASSFVHL